MDGKKFFNILTGVILLFFCLMFFAPMTAMASDFQITFKEISMDSMGRGFGDYGIYAEINRVEIYLGQHCFSKSYVTSSISDNPKLISRNITDITQDGFQDYIVKILTGRGNPDLFFIIDGKTLEVVFSSENCRENMDLRGMSDESRGSREFITGSGYIVEKAIFPHSYELRPKIECVYREETYIYYWSSSKQKFILSKTKIERMYYQNGKKIYL